MGGDAVVTTVWRNAEPASIWRITGSYRSSGTFHDCLAIVLDPAIHGTDEIVFAMLPPLGWGGGMDDKKRDTDAGASHDVG